MMRAELNKSYILLLCLCLCMLTSFVFPETIRAARVTGEDQTVSTESTPQKTTAAAPAAVPVSGSVASTPAIQKAPAASVTTSTQVKGASAAATAQAGTPATPKVTSQAISQMPAPKTSIPAVPSAAVIKTTPPAISPVIISAPTQSQKAATTKMAAPPTAAAPSRQPPSVAAAPPTPAPHHVPTSQPGREQRFVTIDFDNVDIQVFIKFISELTGKNFVIDDKVKGKVTVISPKKIAVDEVYKVFESVLDVYGFATVQSGDVIKIIQSQQAKEKGMETRLQHEAATSEDKYVTQIISLDHASPDEMKRVLDPLISKTSVILSYPPTGMLVIADIMSNIKRLQEIIDALDIEGVGEQISYIPLRYATATEAIKSLNTVFQQQKGTMAPIKIVADERTNALIIAATENDTIRVRELVTLMDKEIPRGAGLIRVYYLQNAKAEDTAKVLTSLQQQTKTADGKPAAVSKSVQIVADKATNSLIITADTADYLVIEDVVRKLDISRPMVYLEALIMEVSTSKKFKLGAEWQGANSLTYDGKTGAYIGGVSGEGGKYNIAAGLMSTTPTLPSGLSLGVIGQAINVAVGGTTLTFPNLSAFIQAYQTDSDIRILSTPQLLTLDNEDAEITIGKNVPYITRQDTTIGTTTNYSNYEYKDVGITLKVTPQINKEGFVRLKIDQTVTAVEDTSDPFRPTTRKRAAKTTVTVKSGDTVVIGGLIDDTTSEGVYKVPLLGDIPLLGWFFKYKSKSGDKQNLFIFITPRIIQKPEDAANIHQDKKDYMESLREGTIKATPPKKKK